MREQVTDAGLGVKWEPNAPEARLLVTDEREARLTLRAHPEDDDQRDVVLAWHACRMTLIGDPNDEALNGHRLYGLGLSTIRWVGEVKHSELVASLERQNRVHRTHDSRTFADLHHWIVPTKECVVEVVARSCAVERSQRAASSERP